MAVQQSEGDDDGALMLRVEGVEREPVEMRPDNLPSSGSVSPGRREDVDALADDFKRRMGVLKKVVGEGERRRPTAEEKQVGEEEGVADEAIVDDENERKRE